MRKRQEMGFLGRIVFALGLSVPLATAALGAGAGALEPTDVKEATWEGVSNLSTVENLWLSGQPDENALRQAREAGVEVVINLRGKNEFDWDEAAAARSLGLEYHNIPIAGAEPFSPQALGRIDEVVAKHPDDQILIHCSSANRAGAWFAVHLAQQRGMSVDDALAVGRAAGITKEAISDKVREYLGRSGEPR